MLLFNLLRRLQSCIETKYHIVIQVCSSLFLYVPFIIKLRIQVGI